MSSRFVVWLWPSSPSSPAQPLTGKVSRRKADAVIASWSPAAEGDKLLLQEWPTPWRATANLRELADAAA